MSTPSDGDGIVTKPEQESQLSDSGRGSQSVVVITKEDLNAGNFNLIRARLCLKRSIYCYKKFDYLYCNCLEVDVFSSFTFFISGHEIMGVLH